MFEVTTVQKDENGNEIPNTKEDCTTEFLIAAGLVTAAIFTLGFMTGRGTK